MPSLNYKKQFAPLVESGAKRQTIRALRKRPFKVGDTLYHYTGLRTKSCLRLGWSKAEEVIMIEVFPESIQFRRAVHLHEEEDNFVNDLPASDIETLALADGFDGVDAFFAYFIGEGGKGFPFIGQLIKWPTTWCPDKGE